MGTTEVDAIPRIMGKVATFHTLLLNGWQAISKRLWGALTPEDIHKFVVA